MPADRPLPHRCSTTLRCPEVSGWSRACSLSAIADAISSGAEDRPASPAQGFDGAGDCGLRREDLDGRVGLFPGTSYSDERHDGGAGQHVVEHAIEFGWVSSVQAGCEFGHEVCPCERLVVGEQPAVDIEHVRRQLVHLGGRHRELERPPLLLGRGQVLGEPFDRPAQVAQLPPPGGEQLVGARMPLGRLGSPGPPRLERGRSDGRSWGGIQRSRRIASRTVRTPRPARR